MKKGAKIILGIAGGVVIIGAVTLLRGSSDDTPTNPLTSSATTGTVTNTLTGDVAPGSEFLNTLLNLNTIRLSPAVFSNPAFRNLSDVPVSLGTATAGRPNPFAPIGTSAETVLIVTQAATQITESGARLNGSSVSVLPTGASVYFEWGTDETFGSVTLPQKPNESGNVSAVISSLAPRTSYAFRAVYKQGTRITVGDTFFFTTK